MYYLYSRAIWEALDMPPPPMRKFFENILFFHFLFQLNFHIEIILWNMKVKRRLATYEVSQTLSWGLFLKCMKLCSQAFRRERR